MKAMESMKCIKRGVSALMGIGLAMLLSVLFWGSGGSVSAQVAPDPVLVGAGDIATPGDDDCDDGDDDCDDETAQLVLDIIDEEEDPGNVAVFTAGDNAYEAGTKEDFEKGYDPTWGHPEILGRTHPTLGNHEYYHEDSPENAKDYFDYFGAAAGDPSKGYYSYDWGEWHVVALNSMCEQVGGCEADDPMVTWLEEDLEEDLAANPKTCTLAYFHYPLFSSGEHGTDPEDAAQIKTNMTPTWDALYAAGADVVISAHDHDYERFAPQDPEGNPDPERGITEFVVGTGGRALYDWPLTKTEEFPDGVFIPKPNSIVQNNNTHGVLKLTLHPSSYDWQFVPVAGEGDFTDSGTGHCHDGPVPTTTATATITALPKNGGPELMLPVTLVASLALIASGVGALVLLRRSL
jgi:acid phosphatase type 7